MKGDICDGPFGSNLKTEHYTDAGPKVVRLQNIGEGKFIEGDAHISAGRFELLRRHEVVSGDVLVASLGEQLPRACVSPAALGQAIVKADCIRVRPGPGIHPRYLSLFLNSPKARIELKSKIQGIGRPRINLSTLRAMEIPTPPAAEQRRIADELERRFSHLDQAVAGLRTSKSRTKDAKRSLLAQLTSNDWPEHWKKSSVAEAGDSRLGLQRSPDRHSGPNMKPYLKVANVFDDRIYLGEVMSMHFTAEEMERYRLLEGDILLNEGQSPQLLGRPAMWKCPVDEMYFTNSLIRFRCGEDVDPRWALLVFRSHMYSGRFRKESRITTNIAHLALGRLKTVEFPIPPLEEQARIAAETERKLSLLDAAERAIDGGLTKAEQLRRSLLHAAFTGKLVSQDPADEPASELLARIQAERAAAQAAKKEAPAAARPRHKKELSA